MTIVTRTSDLVFSPNRTFSSFGGKQDLILAHFNISCKVIFTSVCLSPPLYTSMKRRGGRGRPWPPLKHTHTCPFWSHSQLVFNFSFLGSFCRVDPYTDPYYDYDIERFWRGGQYENFRVQYTDPDPYRNYRLSKVIYYILPFLDSFVWELLVLGLQWGRYRQPIPLPPRCDDFCSLWKGRI